MNIKGNNAISCRSEQRGAALVVGLILLMVLTVLGISSMNTATLELAMAGNTQHHQEAFQAAETGIDISISQRNFNTLLPAIVPVTALDAGIDTQAVSTFIETAPVPNDAFSIGVGTSAVQAFHFDVVAVGRGPKNAASTHNQSFYIVGPGGI